MQYVLKVKNMLSYRQCTFKHLYVGKAGKTPSGKVAAKIRYALTSQLLKGDNCAILTG